MRRPNLRRTILALAAASAVMPAFADDSATLSQLAHQLEASMKTIQALQQRVEQLERQQAAAPAAAPAAGDWGSRIDAVEHNVAQIEASTAAAQQADTGVAVHGFADVRIGMQNSAMANLANPGADTSADPNKSLPFRMYNGAQMGTLDLYLTPQISPQVKTLFELAFDYSVLGQQLGVDVERGEIGYEFSDAATLWFGRFHTPYGYWSTAFHHGAQLQTALSRPMFLDWEDSGGIMPAHSVGVQLSGAQRTAVGKVGYDVFVNNGDGISGGELFFAPRLNASGKVGAGLRVSLTPAGTSLTVGASALQEDITGMVGDATEGLRVGLGLAGLYAVYDNDDWEAMGEYYAFRNRDLSGGSGSHSSSAWYAQVGYNVNDFFTPYARYEDGAYNANDPYFASQIAGLAYKRALVGLRYNLTPKAALKLEVARGTVAQNAGHPSSLALQYAIRF